MLIAPVTRNVFPRTKECLSCDSGLAFVGQVANESLATCSIEQEAECLEAKEKAKTNLDNAVQEYMTLAPGFAKLRPGASDLVKSLVCKITVALLEELRRVTPLPAGQLESLRDLAKAVGDTATQQSVNDLLMGLVEQSAMESVKLALADLSTAQAVTNLKESLDKAQHIEMGKDVFDTYAAAFPTLLGGLRVQCRSGQVSEEVVKPWIEVLTIMAKDPAMASHLSTSPAVLKTSMSNLITFVTCVVATRRCVREFSSFRQLKDNEASQRTLLLLQSSVGQHQTYVEKQSFGKVDEAVTKAAADEFLTLGKMILEGDPGGSLVGLNTILAQAGKEYQAQLLVDLESKLSSLEEWAGGNFKKHGEVWHHGLPKESSMDVVLSRAKETLLASKKDEFSELNTRLNNVIEARLGLGARWGRGMLSLFGQLPIVVIIG